MYTSVKLISSAVLVALLCLHAVECRAIRKQRFYAKRNPYNYATTEVPSSYPSHASPTPNYEGSTSSYNGTTSPYDGSNANDTSSSSGYRATEPSYYNSTSPSSSGYTTIVPSYYNPTRRSSSSSNTTGVPSYYNATSPSSSSSNTTAVPNYTYQPNLNSTMSTVYNSTTEAPSKINEYIYRVHNKGNKNKNNDAVKVVKERVPEAVHVYPSKK